MTIDRRFFMTGAAVTATIGRGALAATKGTPGMYGLIGKMTAHQNQREALVQVLIGGVAGMPGCLSYVVANDPTDANVIWITEAWVSKEAHSASLSLPSVRAAIAKGRPLIAGMSSVAETTPVGGHGLIKA